MRSYPIYLGFSSNWNLTKLFYLDVFADTFADTEDKAELFSYIFLMSQHADVGFNLVPFLQEW